MGMLRGLVGWAEFENRASEQSLRTELEKRVSRGSEREGGLWAEISNRGSLLPRSL
jgi:hypothetical protein